jgi:hypothetical protein
MMASVERDDNDAFGFAAIGKGADLDLTAFEPKPKAIDRISAEAAAEVAEGAGFTRRAPTKAERKPRAQAAPKAARVADRAGKGRVNINDLLGIEDRYPETQRAQLNLLAPVPVVLRWRQLVKDASVPAWEVLERAMEALEATSGSGAAGSRS